MTIVIGLTERNVKSAISGTKLITHIFNKKTNTNMVKELSAKKYYIEGCGENRGLLWSGDGGWVCDYRNAISFSRECFADKFARKVVCPFFRCTLIVIDKSEELC